MEMAGRGTAEAWRRRRVARAALCLLAVVGSALIGVSCTSGGNEVKLRDDSEVSLLVWHGFESREAELFHDLVKEYQASRSRTYGRRVTVQLSLTPFAQVETKLKTATLAHQTPDLCFFDALKVISLAYGQTLVPLDTLPTFGATSRAALREEFAPAAFDTNVIMVKGEENLYGLPAQTTCVALFYNKALFRRFHDQIAAAGLDPSRPPRDWDELKAYATAMTDPAKGLYGWALNKSLWWSYPYLNGFGAKMLRYEPNGRAIPAFNDARALAVLRELQAQATGDFEGGAWRQGALTPDQGFLEGKYAMCLNGPWKIADFVGAGLDFGVALVPKPSKRQAVELGMIAPDATDAEYDASVKSSSTLGGQNLVMFRTCPDRELAWDFMQWFTSEEIQRRWCETLTQIPVRLAAQDGLHVKNEQYFRVFLEQIRSTSAPQLVPLFAKLETDIFNKELDLLLSGQKEPAAMAASVCDILDREILSRMNAFLDDEPSS